MPEELTDEELDEIWRETVNMPNAEGAGDLQALVTEVRRLRAENNELRKTRQELMEYIDRAELECRDYRVIGQPLDEAVKDIVSRLEEKGAAPKPPRETFWRIKSEHDKYYDPDFDIWLECLSEESVFWSKVAVENALARLQEDRYTPECKIVRFEAREVGTEGKS